MKVFPTVFTSIVSGAIWANLDLTQYVEFFSMCLEAKASGHDHLTVMFEDTNGGKVQWGIKRGRHSVYSFSETRWEQLCDRYKTVGGPVKVTAIIDPDTILLKHGRLPAFFNYTGRKEAAKPWR